MNESTTQALDTLTTLLGRDRAADVLQQLDDAGLRLCWAGDRVTDFLAGGAEIRCASCASLLGRELVARDAADAVHCRVCEARRLDALQTNAERYEAVLSPLAAEVKP